MSIDVKAYWRADDGRVLIAVRWCMWRTAGRLSGMFELQLESSRWMPAARPMNKRRNGSQVKKPTKWQARFLRVQIHPSECVGSVRMACTARSISYEWPAVYLGTLAMKWHAMASPLKESHRLFTKEMFTAEPSARRAISRLQRLPSPITVLMRWLWVPFLLVNGGTLHDLQCTSPPGQPFQSAESRIFQAGCSRLEVLARSSSETHCKVPSHNFISDSLMFMMF